MAQTAYLVTGEGSAQRRVPVGKLLVVGRTQVCDLVIDDGAASRRHVQVQARGDRYLWKDLGSTNGTLLNGRRMLEGTLENGDVLQIGETRLTLEIDSDQDTADPADATLAYGASIFKETRMTPQGEIEEVRSDSQATHLLDAVYAVMNAIAANYDPCDLIDRILETSMQAIKAQRGAILFTDNTGELLPCPVCAKVHSINGDRLEHVDLDAFGISRTVVQRVINNGESVLYQDADRDAELKAAESIMSMALRSILCVPLRAKQRILGVMYTDTNQASHEYREEDLLLTTAVGNSAGLALENATMHTQILEKQRIDQDLATAWTIQQGFLVADWPENDPRFQVYGETRPAKTVGGDFYDFVQPARDTIGILIGDVSGKGVPAALTMAQLLAEFRLRVRDAESPARVLRGLNEALFARSQRGLFCTLCYLTLNLHTGLAAVANAGHHPVMCVGKNGVRAIGEAGSPPLGILEDLDIGDSLEQIAPGETLLMYTDGIVEARSMGTQLHQGGDLIAGGGGFEEYEVEMLGRVAARCYGKAPGELIAAVLRDVESFCAPAPPHDDCTMIAARYAAGAQ